jgi:hypothetical protein
MTPFKRAAYTQADMVKMADEFLAKPAEWFTPFIGHIPTWDEQVEFTERQVNERMEDEVWVNDVYQVAIRPADAYSSDWPSMVHLSIKRLDRLPIHDWRDLQAIKNELVGPEHEALELYPAESRCVDSANQFHLWVCRDPTIRFPFGFPGRYVSDTDLLGKSKQRPLPNA